MGQDFVLSCPTDRVGLPQGNPLCCSLSQDKWEDLANAACVLTAATGGFCRHELIFPFLSPACRMQINFPLSCFSLLYRGVHKLASVSFLFPELEEPLQAPLRPADVYRSTSPPLTTLSATLAT